MHWIDWCIALIPFLAILGLAVYSRKYARGLVDYLAAGRVAGRYVISVGDVAAGLSVISLVASAESNYKVGFAMGFWNNITLPLGMFLALTGFCTYRYRAARVLSMGQFLEIRYNHAFRIFAAALRTVAEMVTNAIGPAVATNFFIYFLGLPHRFTVFGINLPTFSIIVVICLTMAMICIWPAGRVSLLLTDTMQGIFSYPIFVMIFCFIFYKFAWGTDIVPVIMDRVPGESFLNSFDIGELRDFNMFALVVSILGSILNRAVWMGNDTSNSGKTPHEQKMAGVLGTWRNGFSWLSITVLVIMIITVMNSDKYYVRTAGNGFSSHETRIALVSKIAGEVSYGAEDPEGLAARIEEAVRAVPVPTHQTNPVRGALAEEETLIARGLKDAPSEELKLAQSKQLSQRQNLDTPYINAARAVFSSNLPADLKAEAAAIEAATARALEAARADGRIPAASPELQTTLAEGRYPLYELKDENRKIQNATAQVLSDAKQSGVIPTPSAELAAAQGANAKRAQKLTSLYNQMMTPVALRRLLPRGMTGFFILLMFMLLISTDDSRIFNASSTLVQDCVLPFFKKSPSVKAHLALLRWMSVGVCVFFFVVAVFFSQLDYINMFTTIMCAIWTGGAGSIITFGLYSRFGNTVGAWCSVVFGCGTSLVGLVLQRAWASSVVPFLVRNNWDDSVRLFLGRVAEPLNPWVDWTRTATEFAEKFPINSTEILAISMVLSVATYVLGSYIGIWTGAYKPFDLDRMLHRGAYLPEEERALAAEEAKHKKPSILARLVGITKEYTRGDRIIAWSVFFYTCVYKFLGCFLGVWAWNVFIRRWSLNTWGWYYWFTTIFMGSVVGVVSTVWFVWGGVRDALQLFKDLEARVDNPLDNGMVVGHESAVDAARDKEAGLASK